MNLEILIVGGGISGLGCARTLFEKGIPFKLISENVGGRILFSKDNVASFGPWYARKDYEHVWPFLKIRRRVGYFDITFHKGQSRYYMFGLHFIKYPIQALKTIYFVNRYKKEYLKFKKDSLYKSQKEVIDLNPYLKKLHEINAIDFIKDKKIENFVNDFLAEVIYGTTFLPISKLSAGHFLHFSLPLVTPAYRFWFDKKKILAGIEDQIILDTVVSIRKEEGYWIASTASGEDYKTKYLVVATPPEVAKKLLKIDYENAGVGVYMFYIHGKLKKFWHKGGEEVFEQGSDIIGISREYKDDYLFCSKIELPNFSDYFESFQIVESKNWDPAFHFGKQLFEANPGDNIYFAGDYIYPNIEDSYITGLYAANKISKNLTSL